jgi:hypothetical protein
MRGPYLPTWNFAYIYGNLFEEQLKISVGILGESPWGSGGPKLRTELESREYIAYNDLSRDAYMAVEGLIGMRFEYKPSYIHGLNVGFVLNQSDQVPGDVNDQTFGDVLRESVVGLAYENDYFAIRAGYRFDSIADKYTNKMNEGGRFTYRLEERFLKTIFDGMQLSLNGSYYGIGNEKRKIEKIIGGQPVMIELGSGEYSINWLYWLWDAESFIAKFDACFSIHQSYNNEEVLPTERQEYQSLEVLPAFYYKFFNNLLQAGVRLGFGMEFGPGRTYIDAPYQYIFVEPLLRLNISSNAYLAAVYNYTDKYAAPWFYPTGIAVQPGDKSVKHSVNIRAAFTF